jgi:hypothetical protein
MANLKLSQVSTQGPHVGAEAKTNDISEVVGTFDHLDLSHEELKIRLREMNGPGSEALLRGLLLVLTHHGAPEVIKDQLRCQMTDYLSSSVSEKMWIKRVKHVLAYPLAKYLRNSPPNTPDCVFKATGRLKGWLDIRLLAFNRKNTHLWYSWYQAKRSCLPLTEDVVHDTYLDHAKVLTRKDPLRNTCDCDDIFNNETFNYVLHKVRDRVTKTFKPSTNSHDGSNSACFELSRSWGGQSKYLLEHYAGFPCEVKNPDGYPGYHPSWLNLAFTQFESTLVSMVDHPRIRGKNNGVVEFREAFGSDGWHSMPTTFPTGKRLTCTIQAVLEPLKVRVISKGEALPYYIMAPLQKALHSALRKIPCFRLIGRPFSPCDVQDLRKCIDPSWEWFSVDYSAATDNLSWKFTSRILSYLTMDLDEEIQAESQRVLGPHILHYPRMEGFEDMPDKIQTNGQLMGSILSFPILCLANLGVYLKTMKSLHVHIRDRVHSYKDRKYGLWSHEEKLNHVLINGDDMLYAAPASKWDEHIRNGNLVGLTMSPGKAYHHPIYANINSTSIHCKISDKKSTPWQIDFLNTGLFFGQHKVMAKDTQQKSFGLKSTSKERYLASLIESEEDQKSEDDDRTGDTIHEYVLSRNGVDLRNGHCGNINLLMQGSLPGGQGKLLKNFINSHHDAINQETLCRDEFGKKLEWDYSHFKFDKFSHRNLFLPLCSGGMGVVPPCGWKTRYTLSDYNRAARHFVKDFKLCQEFSTQPPHPGYEIEVIEFEISQPWSKPGILESAFRHDSGRLFPNKFLNHPNMKVFWKLGWTPWESTEFSSVFVI